MASKWKTLKFEEMGASIPNLDFEGLVGIEECHDYGVVTSKMRNKKKRMKENKEKRKAEAEAEKNAPPTKKPKVTYEGSFKVESVGDKVSPLPKTTTVPSSDGKKKKKSRNVKNGHKKPSDVNAENENSVPLDQMEAWSSFAIPEPILQALADQGFKKPTLIQELTLPAAMHGRRDILGAAETGSGKTLAFGIPIIKEILELKRKIALGEVEIVKTPRVKILEDTQEPKIVNINKMTKEQFEELKWSRKRKRRPRFEKEDSSDDDKGGLSDPEDSDDESDDEDDNESEDKEEDEALDSEKDSNDNESEEKDEDEALKSEDDSDIDKSDEESVNESDDESDDPNVRYSLPKEISDDSDFASGNDDDDNKTESENKTPIITADDKPLFALILTPTRELAIQVKNHLVAAAKHTDLRIAVVVGGMAQVKQERILSKCPEIVVATPGRLWEMIQQGNDHLIKVPDIRFLAIDETDRMIERGHFEELHHLLDKINDNEHKRLARQNFVFSATLTMVHDLPSHLKTKKVTKKGNLIKKKATRLSPEQKLHKVVEMLGITNPKVVDITKKNQGSSNTLTECRITCPIDQKDYFLYYVLKKHPGRTIVFCNSIGCVKRLTQLFGLLQCNPMPIHASMQQRQRLKNLDRFRDHPLGLLIATDVAARGLDIPNVEHVIHYQVPRTAENYVHRSGRTARASKEGITILIMEPGEAQNYAKLCKTLSKTEDLPHFPILNAFLAATKQRVDLARDLDQLEFRMKKTNTEIGWYEKAMREMDIVLDEGEKPRKVEKKEAARQKMEVNIKKKQLNSLLATPLFPKGFSFKYPTSNSEMDADFGFGKPQNALEAMKSAIESGTVKKGPKKEEFTPLASQYTNYDNLKRVKKNKFQNKKSDSRKALSKNKWKKMKKTHSNGVEK